MAKFKEIKLGAISSHDRVIALMGPTGTGKSTFVEVATRQNFKTVGHGLQSCTSSIRAVRFSHPRDSRPVVFVDTPGFDNTSKLDTEILCMLADWLETTYKNQIKLAGIIYFHRISDNRMTGSPLKNFGMFGKLCGEGAIGNVVLATTMWGKVRINVGASREQELLRKYWRRMLESGSRAMRFEDTFGSAWDIVDSIVKKEPAPSLLLQQELVDFHRSLDETEAGMTLLSPLQKQLAEQKEAVRKLLDTARRRNDVERMKELTAQYQEIDELHKTFKYVQGTTPHRKLPADQEGGERIIAVMGPTGAGKSSFINMVTGNDTGVGHSLESCTTRVQAVKLQYPDRYNLDLVFVDTPGCDLTNNGTEDVFQMIVQWLEKNYVRKIKFAGIIYLHRISDNRVADYLVTGSPLKNLRVFERLCGKDALQNVVLATTMWDEVDEKTGLQREDDLKDKYWKAMITQGSATIRYQNTLDSAWDIVEHCLKRGNSRET